MKQLLSIIILLTVLASCKTVGIQTQNYNQVELATIGATNNKPTYKEFKTSAIPKLTNKIRVGILLKTFTKTSFKNYKKANKQFGKISQLTYIDSIANKPTYLKISIIDKLSLLNNINGNKATVNYLKTADKPEIITTLSLVFPKNIQKDILKADELYITQNKNHKYVLEVVSNKTTQNISFSKAIVFNYKTSHFCWGINNKYQIQLVDINNKCSKNAYRSYQKAKKKNEFHFMKL